MLKSITLKIFLIAVCLTVVFLGLSKAVNAACYSMSTIPISKAYYSLYVDNQAIKDKGWVPFGTNQYLIRGNKDGSTCPSTVEYIFKKSDSVFEP